MNLLTIHIITRKVFVFIRLKHGNLENLKYKRIRVKSKVSSTTGFRDVYRPDC